LFLFGIPRWSEDLEFALERNREVYDFRRYLTTMAAELRREGYEIDVKVSDLKVVHGSYVRFPGLPHELGFSARKHENLTIKVEVDTRPPEGARLATTVVRRHALLHIQHHDQASLLAGKLRAVLDRPYVKGRDLFDLLWYLSDRDWPAPNLSMLNNALRQSGHDGQTLTQANWRKVVRDRVRTLDWSKVQSDVAPFLESTEHPDLNSLESLLVAPGLQQRLRKPRK